MQKPVQIQTATMISAIVLVGASCEPGLRREPGRGHRRVEQAGLRLTGGA